MEEGASGVIILNILIKNRAIIRPLSLCHFDFVLLKSTGTPYRLSLIRIISLNQYMHHKGLTIARECVLSLLETLGSFKTLAISKSGGENTQVQCYS